MLVFDHKNEKGATVSLATTLTLPFDRRTKSRQRVVLDDGTEAALLLPRGTTLVAGDHLGGTAHSHVIAVLAAHERLSSVVTEDHKLLNRICYHLGNRHVPLQIGVDRVSYRADHVLDDMVRGLGGKPVALEAAFQPEAGAYGHAHSHD